MQFENGPTVWKRPAAPPWHQEMPDFVRHARHSFLRSIACHEVNTGPVQRAGNSLGEKGPVVAGIVPGQTALIARRKPELFHEIHRGACLLAIDRHFAFLVNFHAAKGPQHGIGKSWRITKRMAQSLADGHAEFFQFLAGREMLFPGIGESCRSPPSGKYPCDTCSRHPQRSTAHRGQPHQPVTASMMNG